MVQRFDVTLDSLIFGPTFRFYLTAKIGSLIFGPTFCPYPVLTEKVWILLLL